MFHIACIILIGKDGKMFEEVEIVHENWISQDRKSCFFPPFMKKQLKQALKKALSPSPDWKKYEMEILKTYGTYEEANKKLSLLENITSNFLLNHEEMTPKRQKTLKDKCALTLSKNLALPSAIDAGVDSGKSISLIEHSTNINNHQVTPTNNKLIQVANVSNEPISFILDISTLQKSPFITANTLISSLQRNNHVLSSSHHTSQSELNRPVSSPVYSSPPLNSEVPLPNQSLPISSTKNLMDVASFEKKVLSWMKNTDKRLKKIDQDRAYIFSCLTSKTDKSKSDEDMVRSLPLKNQKEFADFEEYLMTAKNFKTMAQYLSNVGGKSLTNITRRILKNVMTADLLSEFNWTGLGSKETFSGTNMSSLVISAVQQNKISKSVRIPEIEEEIKEFMNYAPILAKHLSKKKKAV